MTICLRTTSIDYFVVLHIELQPLDNFTWMIENLYPHTQRGTDPFSLFKQKLDS